MFFKIRKLLKKQKLRNQGRLTTKVFWHDYAGFNFRMTNIQVAIGITNQIDLRVFNSKKKVFRTYDNLFEKHNDIILLPKNKWSTNSLGYTLCC